MSSVTREIVTLQFGHYSNFVGTHFWNIQNASFVYHPSQVTLPKEVNNDILFREGQNLSGEVTYTPRLIALDLKGSLNVLKQSGTLYDIQEHEERLLWSNDITMHTAELASKNEFLCDLEKSEAAALGHQLADEDKAADEVDKDTLCSDAQTKIESDMNVFGPNKYYNLDDSVTVWSDFLHPHLHHRSIHIIDSHEHASDANTFDVHGLGVHAYNNRRNKSEIEDKLHFFAEECDSLQGFHMFVDTFNGFGGLSSAALVELADDFPNKAIMIFSVLPSSFPNDTVQQRQYRIVNGAISYERLVPLSSLFLPLSMSTSVWQPVGSGLPVQFPHVQYRPELSYHTSSILAAAVDSLSMPYRTVNNPSLMCHLTAGLTPVERKVVRLDAMFPFAMSQSKTLLETLMEFGDSSTFQSLTPSCLRDVSSYAQSAVLSGIPPNRVFGAPSLQTRQLLSNCSTTDDLIALYLKQSFNTTMSAVCTLQRPCHVTVPFPHIFKPSVGVDGFLTNHPRLPNQGVESVPVMTLLQSSQSVEGHLEELLTQTQKLDIRRLHRFMEAGLEMDEFNDVVEGLQSQLKCYQSDSVDMH